MSNFNSPVDIAWRAYRKILQQEELDAEAMHIAQQSYKDGWHECERQQARAALDKDAWK